MKWSLALFLTKNSSFSFFMTFSQSKFQLFCTRTNGKRNQYVQLEIFICIKIESRMEHIINTDNNIIQCPCFPAEYFSRGFSHSLIIIAIKQTKNFNEFSVYQKKCHNINNMNWHWLSARLTRLVWHLSLLFPKKTRIFPI